MQVLEERIKDPKELFSTIVLHTQDSDLWYRIGGIKGGDLIN